MIPYTQFQYIYPPRSKSNIKFGTSVYKQFKQKDYIAQLKLNGQRTLIYFYPNGDIQLWGRHNCMHRNYHAPSWLIEDLRSIYHTPNAFTVLDGELLHNKSKTFKNTLYIWDVLVWAGQYVTQTTYAQRHAKLFEITKTPTTPTHNAIHQITNNIWLAKNLSPKSWDEYWYRYIKRDIVEGIVIKNPNSKLKMGFSEHNNSDLIIRCRKPHKNYAF